MNALTLTVVIGLAALVLVPLTLRALILRWLGRVVGRAAMAAQPEHIRLVPATPGVWSDPVTPARLAAEYEHAGFQDGGTYTVAEMPGVVVRLLGHPGESLLVAICEHPSAGIWTDCVCPYQDGTHAQVSTLPPTGLDTQPGCVRLSAPGLGPVALLERLRAERPDRPVRPVIVSALAAEFEQAYADETAWRRGRGISGREVAEVARRMKPAA